ncbi:hypothetical protein [Sphingomonas sp. PR090111-T3T-6A]|uniref:hypothetical protein n=1 Tax=Sphingomonas sp. PR090111-T3T-6A TaxID=685778 RepID=UPI00036B109B|nr:hypothetical protein [Sphingomonas sp. PR090111-T3T-6A]
MDIRKARKAAASYLAAQGKAVDAEIVRKGGGDDFPEVAIAVALLRQDGDELGRYERALRSYADPGFWDAEIAEAALAYHDQGLIARAALDGRELFAMHRD